jgi:hypothetical protein
MLNLHYFKFYFVKLTWGYLHMKNKIEEKNSNFIKTILFFSLSFLFKVNYKINKKNSSYRIFFMLFISFF